MTGVRPDVAALLACPHCGGALAPVSGGLRCAAGHHFDAARQGYVSLLPPGARAGGDTAAMVAARAEFLAAGHYAALSEAVAAAAGRALAGGPPGGLVELGAGTGHHLARALDRLPGRVGLALDRSPAAARRAARAHPRMGAAVCDVWRAVPVRDGAAALVVDVFAPRNGPEVRRVLHPEGALVVAAPRPGHLAELVDALGLLRVDARKEERIAAALGAAFTTAESVVVEHPLALPHRDVERLVAMGPSAWHARPAELAGRIAALPDPAPATASVTVTTYRPA